MRGYERSARPSVAHRKASGWCAASWMYSSRSLRCSASGRSAAASVSKSHARQGSLRVSMARTKAPFATGLASPSPSAVGGALARMACTSTFGLTPHLPTSSRKSRRSCMMAHCSSELVVALLSTSTSGWRRTSARVAPQRNLAPQLKGSARSCSNQYSCACRGNGCTNAKLSRGSGSPRSRTVRSSDVASTWPSGEKATLEICDLRSPITRRGSVAMAPFACMSQMRTTPLLCPEARIVPRGLKLRLKAASLTPAAAAPSARTGRFAATAPRARMSQTMTLPSAAQDARTAPSGAYLTA
mmetsp:Transcript_6849/g.19938  ORF Transcript_6849/g.19938 Transcript_6849/m.19938 type:complete len:300 (-) Transcript_6849:324-1223(-)